MVCIFSLNTYCLDELKPQGKMAEVACIYLLRYVAATVGSNVMLPVMGRLGWVGSVRLRREFWGIVLGVLFVV
jgi:hypothetical protein